MIWEENEFEKYEHNRYVAIIHSAFWVETGYDREGTTNKEYSTSLVMV